VFVDKVVVVLEDGESVVVFLFGAIGSVVLADEVDEGSLGITDGSGGEEVGSSLGSRHVQKSEGGNGSGNSNGSNNFGSHTI